MVPKHLKLGEAASATRAYTGQHRDKYYDTRDTRGIGLIPLGDRARDVTAFDIDYIEERDSVDISTSRRR